MAPKVSESMRMRMVGAYQASRDGNEETPVPPASSRETLGLKGMQPEEMLARLEACHALLSEANVLTRMLEWSLSQLAGDPDGSAALAPDQALRAADVRSMAARLSRMIGSALWQTGAFGEKDREEALRLLRKVESLRAGQT